MFVIVKPDGAVSVTVTIVPFVGPVLAVLEFETVTVYVAPTWPCAKLPTCVLAILSEGARITVESLLFAVADPPPATLTWLICGEVALAPTFTVAVIGG